MQENGKSCNIIIDIVACSFRHKSSNEDKSMHAVAPPGQRVMKLPSYIAYTYIIFFGSTLTKTLFFLVIFANLHKGLPEYENENEELNCSVHCKEMTIVDNPVVK